MPGLLSCPSVAWSELFGNALRVLFVIFVFLWSTAQVFLTLIFVKIGDWKSQST